MQTIDYLNKYGIDSLVDDFNIKASTNELYPNIYVLNYDQINSPKTHEITKECRSLLVENIGLKWNVISRSFDRFFNYGENGFSPDLSDYDVYEKYDGSIVSVSFYNDQWLYRTRSMIMPDGKINDFDRSWKDAIESNINFSLLDENLTYIFELVCRENRVVTKYDDVFSVLLSVRKLDGEYVNLDSIDYPFKARKYKFGNTESILGFVENMEGLKEGFVCYKDGTPLLKVKSPSYVAAHRLRGNGLSVRSIIELVAMNEQDEYLSVFPEDQYLFSFPLLANSDIQLDLVDLWADINWIESQKDFACRAKDSPYSFILFQARSRNIHPLDIYNELELNKKVKLIRQYIENYYE